MHVCDVCEMKKCSSITLHQFSIEENGIFAQGLPYNVSNIIIIYDVSGYITVISKRIYL